MDSLFLLWIYHLWRHEEVSTLGSSSENVILTVEEFAHTEVAQLDLIKLVK